MNKLEQTIDLLKTFEPMALQLDEEGYYLCYSGGKDSDVLLHVAIEAGVKFSANYNITTVDPPEVLRHIKQKREWLKKKGITLYMHKPSLFTTGKFKGQRKTMYKLIVHKGMLPTRLIRYCCSELKERGGKGNLCLTGVRWEESNSRRKRTDMEIMTAKFSDKVLFNDNDEERKQFENCMQKGKRLMNPIISWTENEVWEYLKSNKIEYCKLYDEGWHRIGCIGCPMAGYNSRISEFNRYPTIKAKYLKAIEDMIAYRKETGKKVDEQWDTTEKVFSWWMEEDKQKVLKGQTSVFPEEGVDD